MKTVVLPDINEIVLAKCKRSNGEIEHHLIRRINAKDIVTGWQWSHYITDTYFTLEVISWVIPPSNKMPNHKDLIELLLRLVPESSRYERHSFIGSLKNINSIEYKAVDMLVDATETGMKLIFGRQSTFTVENMPQVFEHTYEEITDAFEKFKSN